MPRVFRDLWFRLRALVRPRRVERELGDELRSHLEFETEKLTRAGVAADKARKAALANFGSVSGAVEACRDARGVRLVTDTVADLRFALRQFRIRPFATTAMAAVLAIGLGFSTGIFMLVSSFTSAPLAGADADDDVVRVRGIDRRGGPGRAIGREISYAELLEYRAHTEVFRDVGAWTSTDVVLDVGDGAPNLQSGAGTFVTAPYFDLLGVQFVRGAGLPASFADDGAPQTVGVISHAIWERFYDRAATVTGRTLKVNNTAITIAGVAPPGFVGARSGGSVIRVWLPLNTRALVLPSAPHFREGAAVFGLIARLQPRVSLSHANTVASTVASRVATTREEGRPGPVATDVAPLLATNYFPPSGEPDTSTGPILSMAMPLLVLLITGTSVSAFLAGQALARRREIAVRLALGAHRQRIVRQLLTETALLGLFAAALALCVLWWTIAGAELAVVGTGAVIVLDWRAMTFAGGLALVASLAFGLSPALHSTRTAVSEVLKEQDTAQWRTRLQATLVVAQIAFTQPALLMMGSLLLELRAEWRQRAPATAAADRILEVGFNTNPRYGAQDARREDAIARVRARIAALPGVAGVVADHGRGGGSERVVSHPDDRGGVAADVPVGPVAARSAPDGYFEFMGLSVVQGRAFGGADRGANDIAIVNRELARRLWGEAPPLGRRLVIVRTEPDPFAASAITVIGVVDDEGEPRMYQPPAERTTSQLLVRTHGPADAALHTLREVALDEAPDLPVTYARSLASVEAEARRGALQGLRIAAGAGAVTLTLAAVGLYAVVAVTVGQRRREIGVRAALGADHQMITVLFMKRGLGICAAGAVIGLGGSVLALRVLSEVRGAPMTPGLIGLVSGVTAFVIGVAVVATWIPARRAAAIDPLSVLKAE